MSDDFENKNSEYDVYSQNASDSAKQETEGEKAAFDEPEKSDNQPAQPQGSLNDFYTKPQENRSETPYTPYGYNARQPQQNARQTPPSGPQQTARQQQTLPEQSSSIPPAQTSGRSTARCGKPAADRRREADAATHCIQTRIAKNNGLHGKRKDE